MLAVVQIRKKRRLVDKNMEAMRFQEEVDLQSWPKLCGTSLQNALPRPSMDHQMETSVLWAKFYLPPSPHAMLFVRKGLPKSRPTLHREGGGGGGGGEEGGSERILQQFGKKAQCPTHFGQDCSSERNDGVPPLLHKHGLALFERGEIAAAGSTGRYVGQ